MKYLKGLELGRELMKKEYWINPKYEKSRLERSKKLKLVLKGQRHSIKTEFTSEKSKGNKIRLGKPAWNKGIIGICKPNKTSFKKGQFATKNNINWKGGITPKNQLIRHSKEYFDWRKSIFERDNYTCQNCGQYGGRLEADHIKPFSKIIKENNIKTIEDALNCKDLWDINNGRTLCKKCHRPFLFRGDNN